MRDIIAKGLMEMKYVPTATQLADALTKALERVLHRRFVTSVMYNTAVKEKFMRLPSLGERKLSLLDAGEITDGRHS